MKYKYDWQTPRERELYLRNQVRFRANLRKRFSQDNLFHGWDFFTSDPLFARLGLA